MCVEQMVKLNNPVSASNGEHAIWVDGVQISHVGPGFPNGSWSGGIFTQNPAGTPFGGLRWRSDANLNLNYIWLQTYAPNDPAGLHGEHEIRARRGSEELHRLPRRRGSSGYHATHGLDHRADGRIDGHRRGDAVSDRVGQRRCRRRAVQGGRRERRRGRHEPPVLDHVGLDLGRRRIAHGDGRRPRCALATPRHRPASPSS